VTNLPNPLEDVNLYTGDAILTAACAWSGANLYADRLVCFGARVGSAETQALCVQANRVVPGFLPAIASANASTRWSTTPPTIN
jgi:putative acyl-CoA dehydrogenase